MLQFNQWLESIYEDKLKPFLEEKEIIKCQTEEVVEQDLKQEIKKAHHQWVEANQYFHNVSDPKLIDHASYKIQAARTKYMYLLNKVKEKKEAAKKRG